MYYRERDDTRRRESTFTEDGDEANKKLRERLQARDGHLLQFVRKGESLTVREWAGGFNFWNGGKCFRIKMAFTTRP
jgi:hypothetical protein